MPFGIFIPYLPYPMANSGLCKASHWLILIGALNWGLVGVGDFMGQDLNVVNLVLGGMPQVESLVYVLVGLSAVMKLVKGKCSM
jgi:uncharacterized membrane protein YuzA (DUF378 family)